MREVFNYLVVPFPHSGSNNYSLRIAGDAYASSFSSIIYDIVTFSLLILLTLVFSYGKHHVKILSVIHFSWHGLPRLNI
jgi:hypothetical protein